MCGIVAVLAGPSDRPKPTADALRAAIAAVRATVPTAGQPVLGNLEPLAASLTPLESSLSGVAGLEALIESAELRTELSAVCRDAESALDRGTEELAAVPLQELEQANASLVGVRDLCWQIRVDRIGSAERVLDLTQGEATSSRAALTALWATDAALSCLDRIEVRGRDSAGLTILVASTTVSANDPDLAARSGDTLLRARAVRSFGDKPGSTTLAFTYKVAAEIGELGDNISELRRQIREDALFRRAIASPDARATVLGHTRWASVGVISEPNAHPLDALASGDAAIGNDQTFAVLNGDVDNYRELLTAASLAADPAITTDAKSIPLLVQKKLGAGDTLSEAFRSTVSSFEGSVAIATTTMSDPDSVHLALRGSGQALYIGCAPQENAYIVASEPYGVVELTGHALRMDGETPGNPDAPVASRGQIVRLERSAAGSAAGLHRIAYDGTPLQVTDDHIRAIGLTTRDIDRRGYKHFLLKEISEAPDSFEKTLRGRIREDAEGSLHAQLPESVMPTSVAVDLADGTTKRILVIGQGTAAVAGQAVARSFADALAIPRPNITVEALPATELSGFHMRAEMRDTLIVAISQSGTTTDTNRTVDLVRQRGARVLAIVNRRGSDLTDKADGVLYTSDGRDVEMSVASTKAFYSQVAAGFLLAAAVAEAACGEEADALDAPARDARLRALRSMPDAMRRVLERRDTVAAAVTASRITSRMHWAVVGNGRNGVTAREIRIKLSELCYKSIACDATEDKKHIDLSSEPVILVCAAGTTGSTVTDIGKEIAIFRAHEARPVVIHTEGAEELASSAYGAIPVPAVHPEMDFVLGAVAGHLFGYETARAIDACATPLRTTRAALEAAMQPDRSAGDILDELRPTLLAHANEWFKMVREGTIDGVLDARTALALTGPWLAANGVRELDAIMPDDGDDDSTTGSPTEILQSLVNGLSAAIDQLTRPIDAIKHQAKTVTVGISRADEALLTAPLAAAVLDAGVPRDHLAFADLRALAALDPLVQAIEGFTRYEVQVDANDNGTIKRTTSGGVATDLTSRTDKDPALRGTKHMVVRERCLLVAKGRADGRNVIIIPEIAGHGASAGRPTVLGIALIHVQLHDQAKPGTARAALTAYRSRYAKIADVVTETTAMDDERLGQIPVIELLTAPISDLADRWG